MTERDYILATNVTRIRAMKDLLRQMLPGDEYGIPRIEEAAVRKLLRSWEAYCEREINPLDTASRDPDQETRP